MSTTKTNLEKSSFLPYVIDAWKKKNHDYVAKYLRASIIHGKEDKLYEELMFLSKLRKFMDDESKEDRWSEKSEEKVVVE